MGILEISPEDAKRSVKENPQSCIVLDVRTKEEREEFPVPDCESVVSIELADIPGSLNILDPKKVFFVLCKSGYRSAKAANFLRDVGYNATNIRGGLSDW